MKKLFSLAMVMIMALALCVPAFAANNGSITLENPLAGETYNAYKVFDVTYNTKKSTYAYSIAGDSAWYDVVSTYAGIKLTKAASENTYAVETTDSFNAAEFANILKADESKSTAIPLTVSDGKASVTGLALGYYFVSSGNGALCNLTTTNPNASIYDKNEVVFEKTADDKSVEVGQVVNYTITGKVPDTTGFTEYTYEITDTMSSGLTFKKDVALKINGFAVDQKYYTIDYPDTGVDFKLTIDVKALNDDGLNLTATEIKVTYSAVVNKNAVAKIDENNAILKYSDDPTDTESYKTEDEKVKTYTAKIVIDKYDSADETKKLAGAKFVLYKEVDHDNDPTTVNVKKFYKYSDETVSWVDAQTDASDFETGTDGAATILGLEDGTYYLLETEAPDGYNLLTEAKEITIAGSDTAVASLTVTAKVANNSGVQLPSTGGMGTTIFYTVGGILMAGAAILLITKKKMANEQ